MKTPAVSDDARVSVTGRARSLFQRKQRTRNPRGGREGEQGRELARKGRPSALISADQASGPAVDDQYPCLYISRGRVSGDWSISHQP